MAEGEAYSLDQIHNVRYDIDENGNSTLIVKAEITSGGSGGGGGAVTIADGADVTQGAKADVAATADSGSFSLVALAKRSLERWTALLARIPASLSNGSFRVSLQESILTGATALKIQGADPDASVPQNPVMVGGNTLAEGLKTLQMDDAGNVYIMPRSEYLEIQTNQGITPFFTSAARTATVSSAERQTSFARGLMLFVDVSLAGTGSITPKIEVAVPSVGTYFTVWTATTALTTNGLRAYLFYPGASGGSYTEVSAIPLGWQWRVTMTHNNANSITYSADGVLLI